MGVADVKLLLAELRESASARFSLLLCVRRTINVQWKRDLWGIWAFRPNVKSVSYVLSARWSSSNPPFRTINSFIIN